MYTKVIIRFDLEVKTGMHIGGSSAFSAIGAVDSPVIRDSLTGRPIVPGSSLKGKLRTLLARAVDEILRMFGSTRNRSRLQFADAFVSNADRMRAVGLTEVKSENTIKRLTAEAMPRQIERVNPDTVFAETIVYDAADEVEMVREILEHNMKTAAKMTVELEVDLHTGSNWFEAH